MFRLASRNVYLAGAFEGLPGIVHGFGTRAANAWAEGAALATVRQVHSDRVLTAEGPGCAGVGDALITDRPGILLSVRTADCVPILMADARRRSVAAVHAGWRGTVSEIAAKTVRAMEVQFGTHTEDLLVAIGPAIGPCCFEVGPEVAAEFGPFFPERNDLTGRTNIDLFEANYRQLRQVGVRESQVFVLRLCTVCTPERFHSFRRDRGAAGRMVSLIGMEA